MWNFARLAGVALLAITGAASPARAGDDFFCVWDCYRAPLPVHVYDYTRGPTWTSNGWAYVPVEVHFSRPGPAGDLVERGRWATPGRIDPDREPGQDRRRLDDRQPLLK